MIDFDDRKRRPKTSELEVIVAIADAGSFGGAAAELGCTQSRISHALGELEDALDARLFDRSRVGARPTEAGSVVVAKAREALQLLDSIANSKYGKALVGTVRIAAYRSVATHLLTPLAHALTKAQRGLRIDIDDSSPEREDVELMILDGRADLGVVHLPVRAGFITTPFSEDDYVAVVPVSYKPSRDSFWADLAKLPLIESRCAGARAAVEACRQHGMRNRTASVFSSDSTIVAQIAVKRGFSILPRLAAEPLADGLVAMPLPIQAFRSLVMIRRKDRRGAVMRAVVDHLVAGIRRPTFEARKWLRSAPTRGSVEGRDLLCGGSKPRATATAAEP